MSQQNYQNLRIIFYTNSTVYLIVPSKYKLYTGMARDLKQDVLKQLKSVFYCFKTFFFVLKH
jgi:hypothetical protein